MSVKANIDFLYVGTNRKSVVGGYVGAVRILQSGPQNWSRGKADRLHFKEIKPGHYMRDSWPAYGIYDLYVSSDGLANNAVRKRIIQVLPSQVALGGMIEEIVEEVTEAASIITDVINEKTTDAGVTVEGVLIQDSGMSPSSLTTDIINEKTADAGVTIEGALIRDSGISLSGIADDSTALKLLPSIATMSSMNVPAGDPITLPNIGDLWFDGTQLYFRKDGSTNIDLLAPDGLWIQTGIDIYYNTGNVGIGVAIPLEKLSIDGNMAVTGTVDGIDIAAHALSIGAHTDITLTNPQDDNVLSYDSGGWVNQTAAAAGLATSASLTAHALSVGTHTDVTITNPQNDNVLSYDSGGWINQTATAAGLALASELHTRAHSFTSHVDHDDVNNAGLADTDLLYWNNAAGEWQTISQGSGGGLDADRLDGSHASAFALSSHGHNESAITFNDISGHSHTGATGEGHTISFGDLSGKPSTYPPSSHALTSHTGSLTAAWITDVAPFSQSGNYASLRARATTKADVGLNNVTNTLQEPAISAGTLTQWWRGDKSWVALDKSDVGLSNVPNTDCTDASNITSGTLDNARFSAYDNLSYATKIGTGSSQVAAGNHAHSATDGVFTVVSNVQVALYTGNYQVEKKTRSLTVADGIVTVIGAESGWSGACGVSWT